MPHKCPEKNKEYQKKWRENNLEYQKKWREENLDYSKNRKKRSSKHRYIYFIGNKTQKKNMLKNLKYEIQPYPKGENKRYDASYKPTTQSKLF